MADKTTVTQNLNITASFYDGDTRNITQTNPKSASELPALILAWQTELQNDGTIIGDLAGAAFKEFTQAKIVTKTVVEFDLG